MTTKIVLRIIFMLFLSLGSASLGLAAVGTESGGGGGDPRASEFINYALLALNYMENPPAQLSHNMTKLISYIDTNSFLNDIKRLEATLATHEPTLRFPGVDTLECFGAPKLGCTNADLSVDIAGNYWNTAPDLAKCTLTLDELFVQQTRLQAIRYRAASIICGALLNSSPVKPQRSRPATPPCSVDQTGRIVCGGNNDSGRI